jgi:hypothetical protein
MAGQKHRDDRRRSAAIGDLLEQEAQKNLLADVGAYEQHLNEGGDPENWVFQKGQQDPFLVRQFQKLKSRFSGGQEVEAENPYETARSGYEASQVQSGIPMQSPAPETQPGRLAYADGGEVDEDDGALYGALAGGAAAVAKPVAKGALAVGRKAIPLGRKLANSKLGKVAAPIAAGAAIGSQTDEDYDERVLEGRFGNFEGTPLEIEDPGEASVGNFAKYFGQRVLGFASDLGNTLTGGLAGKAYQDSEAPAPAPTAAPKVAPDEPKAAALDAQVGGERPTEAVAAEAVNTAVEATPGHPQHPEQDWDFSQLAADGMTSDEIPHVGVNDWKQYRKNHVLAALKRGQSVADANAEVDQVQHQGFLRNFRQASYLAMVGDTEGAALAARAAYQYFPNGSDLRFQSAQGPDGNSYVVGMGYDEESEEMVGTPQVMTPDYINAMLANFEDPKAFNTWKKDQDEAYRLERQYTEIDKPTAQADLDLKGAQTDYYRSGAQKNRADAAGESGATGPTEANKLSAHEKFRDSVDALSIEDEALADQLVSVMGRIYANGGGDVGTIINEIKKLSREEDGIQALNELVAEWAPTE